LLTETEKQELFSTLLLVCSEKILKTECKSSLELGVIIIIDIYAYTLQKFVQIYFIRSISTFKMKVLITV